MSNSAKHDLPAGSIYAPVRKNITERANGEDVKETTTPEDFAKRLVNDTLGGASGKVYRGKFATMTKYLSAFMPAGTLVRLPTPDFYGLVTDFWLLGWSLGQRHRLR
jgi:hypothetical protein